MRKDTGYKSYFKNTYLIDLYIHKINFRSPKCHKSVQNGDKLSIDNKKALELQGLRCFIWWT